VEQVCFESVMEVSGRLGVMDGESGDDRAGEPR